MTTRNEKASILVVEDEAKMRRLSSCSSAKKVSGALARPMRRQGCNSSCARSRDLVVTDLRLPGMSGLEFLQAVKRANAALPVVVMTAYGTVESAVEAMKVGASDYVTKPFSLD